MYVLQPPVYIKNHNNNHDEHNKEKHKRKYNIVKKYDAIPQYQRTGHNYDLRIILLRHAERIDQNLGQEWYDKVFGGIPSAAPQSYKHPSLPLRIPRRSNTLLYVFDPPITRGGEQQSFQKGQQLLATGATVDYCYSSPASRSVITANAILKGMNRGNVPIRLEPFLFEPMNWNSALLLIDKFNPFLSRGDWQQSGYNVDRHYHRLNNYLNLYENENDYYQRSQEFFNSLLYYHGRHLPAAAHGQAARRRKTILVVGHASTTEIFSTIALQQPFNTKVFGEQCGKVPYLHTAVLERDAVTHIWSVRPVMYYV